MHLNVSTPLGIIKNLLSLSDGKELFWSKSKPNYING